MKDFTFIYFFSKKLDLIGKMKDDLLYITFDCFKTNPDPF